MTIHSNRLIISLTKMIIKSKKSKHLKLIKSQVRNLKKATAVQRNRKNQKEEEEETNGNYQSNEWAFNNKRVATCRSKKMSCHCFVRHMDKETNEVNEMTNNAHF